MKELTLRIEENEAWYGPSTKHGKMNPHTKNSDYHINIETSSSCNQDNPLLLSNTGKIIYSEKGFVLDIEGGEIKVASKFSDIQFLEGYDSLKSAFLAASKLFFPPSGSIPPEEFFVKPQYNTWIELIYNQNQNDVLKYAHGIVDNGLPSGILMIDDGWNDYYGSFRFSARKFPDPEAMCDELHALGFKVMMWVTPFISPDSPEYRELNEKDYLIRTKCADGKTLRPVVREWWNGWSAILDMTNDGAVKWLEDKLDNLVNRYGIDGFKFDAGDTIFYSEDDITAKEITPTDHSVLWSGLGLKYKYNEYRAAFRCAGLPFVQRLHDKAHAWVDGVDALVPDTLVQSAMGYAYVCPDMIGGGSFVDFLPGSTTFDPELLIRYCEASALMPMMQFSLAPWRVLNDEQYRIIKKMNDLHIKYSDLIIRLARESSKTGEPIVRSLEYVFPHRGFECINDIFMLGNDILVAPVAKKGERSRTLTLPEGKWRAYNGKVYEGGGAVCVEVPLDELLYFERL